MRTTLKLTEDMRRALLDISFQRYGARGKSRWVCEALASLEDEDRNLESVGLGEGQFVPICAIQLSLHHEDLERLSRLVERIRRQDPLAEGVQSQVLRAAIRWGVQRSTGSDGRRVSGNASRDSVERGSMNGSRKQSVAPDGGSHVADSLKTPKLRGRVGKGK